MTYILDRRTQPFAVSLKSGEKLPFVPESDPKSEDDEKENDDKDKSKENESEAPVKVEIDFTGLADRIAPFPIPAGNYSALRSTKDRVFFLSTENEGMLGTGIFDEEPEAGYNLNSFNIAKKKMKTVAESVKGYSLSSDGKRLIYRTKDDFLVIGTDEEASGKKDGDKEEDSDRKVDLSQWDLRVNVRAEWRQMFFEAWRLQRDFFWDPAMHQVDWKAVREQYAALAPRISTREELNDLIGEMLAELNCSHTYVWGGDQRRPEYRGAGLLGVDVSRDPSGFYRIERVIGGRPWTPDLSSPLSAPGIDAKPGEYIVAVNGRSTASVPNYLELLLDKAGKIVSVTLNDRPTLDGGREVIVKPLNSEAALRYCDWVDNRRQYVADKSGGKLGYIHLTDMGGAGLSEFTGDYLPQYNKPGMIMDVRYNSGGFVAEMILSHLARKPFSFGRPRHGVMYRNPWSAFYGYMAAVCNGETGSDGETFTEGFRRLGLGPIIGTRTWGGWVGIRGDKPFVDWGAVTEPEFTGWGLDSKWMIEGRGTDPDMVVVDDPAKMIGGQDPQLDAAIDYLLKKMAEKPMPIPETPAFPDRSLKQ
jgi:tricorn protease